MSALRRRQRHLDIWPGFVDALATLLMVFIFVLMIFVLGQFYLTRLLSGKDESLARLNRQLAELSELLALERESSAELRITVAQLSAELQSAITAREQLGNKVNQLTAARDALEGRLAELMASRAIVQQQLDQSEAARRGVDTRLLEVLRERDALLGKLRAVERDAEIAAAERAQTAAELEQAIKVIDANRDTIQLQLRDLERLRRDLAALRETRQKLEDEVAALAAARDQLRSRLTTAEEAREEAEGKVVVLLGEIDESEARIRSLSELDEKAQARIAELVEQLSKSESRAVQLQQELGAERDATKKLEARLADEAERTRLAQTELEQREIRLEELLSEHEGTKRALTEEQKISAEAQRSVELLNAQIAALREQLARIEAALETSEAASREQKAQILDLGRRLNAALATKVQELARFRSEFFGRLREVLSDRDDVRIVGDRFVFQSEVLFGSGSAQIGEPGKEKMAQFAATLREIATRIPKDLNWVLQVEGHTDTVPIHNEQFRSNWELSSARAISVVKFLVEQGIPAERLSATGYGEYQPIAPGDLERNRRIEMKLTQR